LDTRCPIGWCLDEDGGHRFLKCKTVRACWRELQLENIRLKLLEAQSAIEFVTAVLALDVNICLKVVVLLWKLWDARNKANAGERSLSSQELCGAVICTVTDIQAEGEKKLQPQHHAEAQRRKWVPSGDDYLKINIDGAFRKETATGACRFIIRNCRGAPLWLVQACSQCQSYERCFDG
jgi:hypothetical protein